jgi:peptidoglycan/LPS O-acetylase OafA/YrhL
MAAAMLSYHFVERPFLQYRTRFERLPLKPAIEDQPLSPQVEIPLEHLAASRD